ncbi:Chain length determinant protein [Planctomycetes bacterium K23_9]|uniref:Chain length determinant protein n=2 Tax=Stieleria marina TaxID=1930275 RepID=A0A517NQJ8_9BACT|nr:Chain length determinant protein [Planctomycetes bacterium K23_9]
MASATLSDIIRTINDRRKSFIATFLITSAVLATLVFAWPNRYGSDGLMFVRLGRGAVSIDPTAQSSKTISLMESRKSEVVSVARMLSSREIAERVVNSVGIDEINQPRTWIEKGVNNLTSFIPSLPGAKSSVETEEYDNQIALEEAIQRVQNWVDVAVPKDTYTVTVFGEGSDPILVRKIVQTLMDEYKRFHVEAHQATGSLEFFEKEVDDSRKSAIASQQLLQGTKAKMGWLSVKAAEEALSTRISSLELSRDEAQSAFAEADSHASALKIRLAQVEQWVPTSVTKGIASKAGEDMRTALYSAQIANSEAMAKLKPSHPKYRLVQKTMSGSQDILDNEDKDREQSLEAINPVYQKLQGEYEATFAKAAGLKSRYESLAAAVDHANTDLVRLNTDGIELAELQWASDVAEKNFLAHSKSLEEARIVSALDTQELSDVAVIQPASLNLKKVGPPRLTLLVLAGALGLLAAALQAILRQTALPMWSETFSHQRRNGRTKHEPFPVGPVESL